jgi:hypothetical protein
MVQGRIVDENHVRRRLFFPGPGLPSGGITVSLRGGAYVLNAVEFDALLGRPGSPTLGSAATFKLEREDSGTESSPILSRRHEGEQATLVRGPDVDFRVSLADATVEKVPLAVLSFMRVTPSRFLCQGS